MITVTLVRHGESEDNMKAVWSGWKDSPLTELGHRQAKALGSAFSASSTRFAYLYSSDLSRARSTALGILGSHADPQPPLQTTPKIREQHFGIAEGQLWTPLPPKGNRPIDELYKEGTFPQPVGRDASFPEGECLNDVARRVEEAIRECILPHLFDKRLDGAHIGLVSHGICLAELISALLKMDPEADCTKTYKGHVNTAWSRLEVSLREPSEGVFDHNSSPPLRVRLIAFNRHDHLDSLIPAADTNEEARAFFGGAAQETVSLSNAQVTA